MFSELEFLRTTRSANQVGTGWFPGQRAEASPGISPGLVGEVRSNPKGIESFSPGVRGTSYPGIVEAGRTSTLKELYQIQAMSGLVPISSKHRNTRHRRRIRCNSFRVELLSATRSQGSSFLATLGWV